MLTELWEPVVLMLREKSKGLNSKGESTDARHWDGATCMSVEVPVMGMEQRGCVKLFIQLSTEQSGGDFGEDKTIYHSETVICESL